MVRYKMVNDTRIQLTAEEEKARDAEEKAWSDGQAGRDLVDLRNERNKLLTETDFYALSDVTITDNMKTYRQALRDITKTYKSMTDNGFAFPTKPTD